MIDLMVQSAFFVQLKSYQKCLQVKLLDATRSTSSWQFRMIALMDDVIRLVLSCANRRQALHIGSALLRARLAASISFANYNAVEPWQSWPRAGTEKPLVVLTRVGIVPLIEDMVRDMYPTDPPRVVGPVNASLSSALASFVQLKLPLPTLH